MTKIFPLEACVFDLDGVIVDTAKYHFQAWRSLANDLGIDFTEDQNESLKGVSRMECLNIILEWANIELSDSEKIKLATRKNENYLKFIETLTIENALPGIEDILNELVEKGIKIGLGSASKNAVPIIKQLSLDHYFGAIVDGTQVHNGKPHPETFLLACEKLKVAPQSTIVFEDAPKGIEAALAGGMVAVGVGEDFVLRRAHFVIQDFESLRIENLLKHLPMLKMVTTSPN